MERLNGFYWVQSGDHKWRVAEWEDGLWYLPGVELPFEDTDLVDISLAPIERTEI